MLFPPCLTNILHSSLSFFQDKMILTKRSSFLLSSSRQHPGCYPPTPTLSSLEENFHFFASTVIGMYLYFYQFFCCMILNPYVFSPIHERKTFKGRDFWSALYLVHLAGAVQFLSVDIDMRPDLVTAVSVELKQELGSYLLKEWSVLSIEPRNHWVNTCTLLPGG